MTRNGRALVLVVGALAAAALAAPWAAGRYRELQLARAAPKLDPEIRRHIATDSDRAWYAYCRKVGTGPLGAALLDLRMALDSRDRRAFERDRRTVEAAVLRLGLAFREIHGFDALVRQVRHDMALSTEAAFERHEWERRFYSLSFDTSMTVESRAREFDGLTLRYLLKGDTARALFSATAAAYCELDRERYRERLRAAIGLGRAIGEYDIVCQMLGSLGDAYQYAGKDDSMRVCYDEGIELAWRYRFIDQAARILRFYANYYIERGRLAMAVDRFTEAMLLADGPGGEVAQPRSQIEYTSFLASLGCWDLVERNLRRIPPLLRKLSAPGFAAARLRYGFDAELLGARLDFATGRVEEGNRRMRQLSESLPPGHQSAGLAGVLDEWSLGLEQAKRAREALEICARGLALCDSAHVAERVPALLLRTARLQAAVGRLDLAEAMLDSLSARHGTSSEDWSLAQLDAEVLRARLLFLRGRRQLARQKIEHVYGRYRAQRRDASRGALGNLEPSNAGALRDAVHEIEQFTPEQGYRFEMEWRSLARRPRPSLPRHADASGDLALSSARPKSPRPPGTHLVYRFTDDVLVRWVADSKGIVVDTIPVSAERCVLEVRRALESIQSEPAAAGCFLGPESFDRLRRLSELLLPPSLAVARDRPLRLEITPDGPLSALPFEALPYPASSGAPPLALTADIAYLRGWSDSAPNGNGSVVIVSSPRVPDDLALRYGWSGHLRESDAEARDALKRWPHAVMLAGADATKDSIQGRWPGASIIYLAAHHVLDPEAPFLGFVPLSASPGAPPDASVLESADIRALDLSACRLAVLASCSSGAPYRSAVRPGPSLGDAFLDAGAASVVRSFWDVGDVEAREFTRVFLSIWRADEPDAVSLGRARREVMKTAEGRSPRVWAVWSVETVLTLPAAAITGPDTATP
jgi:tetratricopeptide (TPR) repeat protein